VLLRHAKVGGRVDHLDTHVGQRLPERPQPARQDEMLRRAIERYDGHLARASRDDLEVFGRDVGMRARKQQRALRRHLRVNHLAHLDGKPAQGIENAVATRREQLLEAAVAQK